MKEVSNISKVYESILKGNETFFIQGAMQTPTFLLEKLEETLQNERKDVTNLRFIHLHTHGKPFYIREDFKERCKTLNFFVGGNIRSAINYQNIDYIPCFLSEIPYLIRERVVPVDIALIQVSRPDEHGYVSLGPSVDITKEAVKASKFVIAMINENVPRVYGDSFIHINDIDYGIQNDSALHTVELNQISTEEKKIGETIASLIDDGSTLQMGIGAIPDAVLRELNGHKDLGIHTEMFSNGVIDLINKGVINNSKKKINPDKTITSFAVGDQTLVDFINKNPAVEFYPANYVNKPKNIAKNPRVVAINSAVEIDLTGQVCADSVGHRIISGVGGQMDFMRGASISAGGKPIIAMASTTKKGVSKISSFLKKGAGVVTTRSHIHYVVTEYGYVNLYGKSIGQRAKDLISIAHPDHRERLEKEWIENFLN